MAADGEILRSRGNRYESREGVPSLTGRLKVHAEGYGFVIPDDSGERDVFVPSRYIRPALPGDRVLVSFYQKGGEDRREGRVMQVLQRGRTHWTGCLVKKGGAYYLVNDDYSSEIEILIPSKKLMGGRIGQLVDVRVTHYPTPSQPMQGEVIEVLGEPHDEEAEVAAILSKNDIHRSFPKDVQDEMSRLTQKIIEEDLKGRVDLRALPFLTIDGVSARDFDDAVYVEKHGKMYRLFVSIADVSHYVHLGGPTDQEASGRGTSVYFPDFSIPMLPAALSNDRCSLRPGEDRLTLTCEMLFDGAGRSLEAAYYESIIKSQKRGIYGDIQGYFDGDPFVADSMGPELKVSLSSMRELASHLLNERKRRGSLDFDLPEVEVLYDQSGRMKEIVRAKRFFSHRLIEEFMIAANVAVAELFVRMEIPLLFRVHDDPDQLKISDFLNLMRNLGIKVSADHLRRPKDLSKFLEEMSSHPAEAFIHQTLLRSMKVAYYDPGNRGHFGLNLKNYCHFTSPIRRYPDLVVHRQLKAVLAQASQKKMTLRFNKKGPQVLAKFKKSAVKGGGMYRFDDLGHIGEATSRRERSAMEAEREMIQLKRALYMQDYIGEKFFGSIRRVTKFGMFVELEPHFVEGLLHVRDMKDDYYRFDDKRLQLTGRSKRHKKFKVGDKIWVSVKDVSLDRREVSLGLS